MLIRPAFTRCELLTWVAAALAMSLPAVGDAADEPAFAEESEKGGHAEIIGLIRKAIAVRDAAARATSSARGRGEYRVTAYDQAMKPVYEERSSFQSAHDGNRGFMQFRYEQGAGYEDPDVYARVVLTDGEQLCESVFCRRIRPTGAEGAILTEFDRGSLQPFVEISGNPASYYSFVDRLLKEKDLELSMREEKDVRVAVFTDEKHNAAREFWIDPRLDCRLVRYRNIVQADKNPIVTLDVRKEWKQADKLWYVKRCIVREKSRKDGDVDRTTETELVFDEFEANVDVPVEVFTVHALGLPDDSRIRLGGAGDGKSRYVSDAGFDRTEVEKIVGALPVVRSAR